MPKQIERDRKQVEICRKTEPDRGEMEAEAVADIHKYIITIVITIIILQPSFSLWS